MIKISKIKKKLIILNYHKKKFVKNLSRNVNKEDKEKKDHKENKVNKETHQILLNKK
jgi:hypothetical protein